MVTAIYYAPKVSGVERTKFHGSLIVGKSHPPSGLCLNATTTLGPYPKKFCVRKRATCTETSRICSINNKGCIFQLGWPTLLPPQAERSTVQSPSFSCCRGRSHGLFSAPPSPVTPITLPQPLPNVASHFIIFTIYRHFTKWKKCWSFIEYISVMIDQ